MKRKLLLNIAMMVAVLAMASWSVAAQVTVINDSGLAQLYVLVYNVDDPFKLIECEALWIPKGQSQKTSSGGWPQCGAYRRLHFSIGEMSMELDERVSLVPHIAVRMDADQGKTIRCTGASVKQLTCTVI